MNEEKIPDETVIPDKKVVFKTFKMDRLLRSFDGIPIGRAVLAGEYTPGTDIMMAVMEVFSSVGTSPKDVDFYIDGIKHKVPSDLPPLKISTSGGKLMVNNFYLMKVEDE